MKKFILPLMALACSLQVKAQLVTGNVFLKGNYVEVGTFNNGAFGTSVAAPAGYHPMASCSGGSTLGFVSDPDKDGWLVSSPGHSAYMGDYFVPGTPFEGWEIQVNGSKGRNWASGMGVSEVTTTSSSYTATGSEQTGVWQGTFGDLAITQTTVLKTNKLYFVIYVDLVNTGTTTLTKIYYHRGLDPDNEQPWASCSHITKNTIVFQPNATSTKCLATADGITYGTFAYLGLGTKDCRAKCMNIPGWHPGSLEALYNQTGTEAGNAYTVGWTGTGDQAIGLVYNLGSLAPGQKTTLAYTYILKQADLDSALGETEPKFESDGVPYAPYTTFRVCPGKTVPLSVANGGQYKWIWTPGTYMTAKGVTSTTIPAGGTVPTVTGSKVYPDGGVYGDSVEVTVWGPKTYTAMGISNCDTQYLTFYVDTISFTTPPSVTTPIRYCEGEAATALTAGAATGATLRWYTTPSGGTSSLTAPTPSTIFGGPAGVDFDTLRYYVSQVNPAGCETPRAEIEVIITRKPVPPVTSNLIYCIWETTQPLTAAGTSIKWYDAATAGTRYPSTPTPANNPAGTTTYFASQTLNGCESDRSPLSVEISEAVATFEMSEDSLCGDELLVLTNKSTTSSPGSYTNAWSFGDGASATDSNTSHSYADMRNDYIVKLVITNANGCIDSTQQTIRVFPKPTISFVTNTDKICQGNTIDFTGTATAGYTSLLWDFGDGDPAYNTLQVRHAFSKAGLFNVTFTGTFPACDGVSAASQVNVVAIPNMNLGPDSTMCPGNAAMILKNLSGVPADHYLWSTGDTTASIPIHHHGDYWLRATNWQCTSTDSITISKGCYLDIPNAFTPGAGNDYNGYFLPRELLSKSVVAFEMKIFDRWGQLIFETDKTKGIGWDGAYKGQDMPYGVYVYLIKVSFANGITESYNGNVTLLR